jgi:hypothetical protein
MSGSGTLTQTGPAKVTVLANSYRGGTFISGGTLVAADEDALGAGDVDNAATLAGARILVRGKFRQRERGSLELGAKGELVVAGQASLAGTLRVRLDASARIGDRFVVVRAAGISGRFRAVVGENLPPDATLVASYDGARCWVTVVRNKAVATAITQRRGRSS